MVSILPHIFPNISAGTLSFKLCLAHAATVSLADGRRADRRLGLRAPGRALSSTSNPEEARQNDR
jgi:hypothetical protein